MESSARRARSETATIRVSRHDAASYVAALASDLSRIARSNGMPTLAYLLDLARLEAEAHVGDEDLAGRRPDSGPDVGRS